MVAKRSLAKPSPTGGTPKKRPTIRRDSRLASIEKSPMATRRSASSRLSVASKASNDKATTPPADPSTTPVASRKRRPAARRVVATPGSQKKKTHWREIVKHTFVTPERVLSPPRKPHSAADINVFNRECHRRLHVVDTGMDPRRQMERVEQLLTCLVFSSHHSVNLRLNDVCVEASHEMLPMVSRRLGNPSAPFAKEKLTPILFSRFGTPELYTPCDIRIVVIDYETVLHYIGQDHPTDTAKATAEYLLSHLVRVRNCQAACTFLMVDARHFALATENLTWPRHYVNGAGEKIACFVTEDKLVRLYNDISTAAIVKKAMEDTENRRDARFVEAGRAYIPALHYTIYALGRQAAANEVERRVTQGDTHGRLVSRRCKELAMHTIKQVWKEFHTKYGYLGPLSSHYTSASERALEMFQKGVEGKEVPEDLRDKFWQLAEGTSDADSESCGDHGSMFDEADSDIDLSADKLLGGAYYNLDNLDAFRVHFSDLSESPEFITEEVIVTDSEDDRRVPSKAKEVEIKQEVLSNKPSSVHSSPAKNDENPPEEEDDEVVVASASKTNKKKHVLEDVSNIQQRGRSENKKKDKRQ